MIVHEPDHDNLAFTTTWGGGGGRKGWLIPTIFSESYISWDVIACIYININRIHYCNCKIVKPPNSNCYHAGMTSPDTQLSETYSRSPPPPPSGSEDPLWLIHYDWLRGNNDWRCTRL